MRGLGSLVLLALATGAFAEKEADPLKEVVKEIDQALGKNDAVGAKAAFAKAETIKANYDAKKFDPVLKSVGKGVGHKNPEIARAAVEALGGFKVPGSSKLLGKALSPPAKFKAEQLAFYQAAIAAAGAIHDTDSLKALEKLVVHDNAEIGSSAARALGEYKVLDPKPRKALAGRLVKILERLEKEAATAKKDEEKEAAEKVRAALVEGLLALTGQEGLATADDFEKWLEEGGKEEQPE